MAVPKGTISRVVYQKESKGDTFIVIAASPDMVKKWRSDKTIPLIEVVDGYKIFSSRQGAQGQLAAASRGELENEFGTSNEDEVIKRILQEGHVQEGKAGEKWGTKNESHGALDNPHQ